MFGYVRTRFSSRYIQQKVFHLKVTFLTKPAVAQCHPAIVELLLQYGALIDDFGPDEVTALHLAVRQKSFALVVILLRYGANPLFTARYDAYKFSFGQTKVEHEFRTPLATCKALTWERGIGLLEEAEEAWAWAGKK